VTPTTWRQTADDSCAPPKDMAVSGFVRRRAWEIRVGHYTFELASHIGVEDFESMLVVCWTCQVWHYGIREDFLASGTKPYTGLPVPGERLAEFADGVKPSEVKRYAVWGDLLFELAAGTPLVDRDGM
jgi:hypothetical protein